MTTIETVKEFGIMVIFLLCLSFTFANTCLLLIAIAETKKIQAALAAEEGPCIIRRHDGSFTKIEMIGTNKEKVPIYVETEYK